MESHVVAKVARESDVPFAVLRVVSDPSNRSMPEAAIASVTNTGHVSIGRVLRGVAIRPWEMPEMLSLAFDARIAFSALRCVARRCASLFSTVGLGRGAVAFDFLKHVLDMGFKQIFCRPRVL